MASSLITTYLGSGLLADRPAAPSVPSGGLASYYATDTGLLYVYDSSWHTVSPVTSVFGRTGAVVAVSGDYTSAQISYDNAVSGLAATDVKEAIDELAGSVSNSGVVWIQGGFGDSGTVNTSARATKGIRITPTSDITVDAVLATIDQSANSDNYYAVIASLSDATDTATISSVLATTTSQSTGTSTSNVSRFPLNSPIVLSSGTTYFVGIVFDQASGTAVCRVFGSAGKSWCPMGPLTRAGRFQYNTVSVTASQSPAVAEADDMFIISLEGSFTLS